MIVILYFIFIWIIVCCSHSCNYGFWLFIDVVRLWFQISHSLTTSDQLLLSCCCQDYSSNICFLYFARALFSVYTHTHILCFLCLMLLPESCILMHPVFSLLVFGVPVVSLSLTADQDSPSAIVLLILFVLLFILVTIIDILFFYLLIFVYGWC